MSEIPNNGILLASPEKTKSKFSIERREEHQSGVTINHVKVYDESQESKTYRETKRTLDDWDDELLGLESPLPPIFDKVGRKVIPRNPVSERFFSDPSIQSWGMLMPSAEALYYLTHLEAEKLPDGTVISDLMTRFMTDMDDGIGIRTRKRIASDLVRKKISLGLPDQRCLSLACGAADLMLESISSFENRPTLKLVDIDDHILDMARSIAVDINLDEGSDFVVENRDLVSSMIRSDSLVSEVGEESQLVVDAIGINEYFSDALAARFLHNAYRCVEPGGCLITSNMLSDRNQMMINKVAIGWPKVFPRSIDEIIEMIESANIPLDNVNIFIPKDGVYAVVEINKPERPM